MNRQELEYLTRRYGYGFLIAFSCIAFLLPLILRIVHGAPVTPGAESYLYLRYANLHSIVYDSIRHVPLAPSPYAFLLAGMQAFGVPWLLPLLLFLLLLTLLYYYLMRFIEARAVIVIALLAFVLSPTMSVLATTHTPVLLALVFLVGALLLFDHRPVIACCLVWLAIVTAAFTSLLAVIFLALLFLRQKKDHLLIGILLATVAGIAWYLLWTGTIAGITLPSFSPMLFELGNPMGISAFFLIIAGYAMVMRAGKAPVFVFITLAFLAATFFLPALLPITAFLLSLQIGYAIVMLIADRWVLELLQQSLLLLIACIGLFLIITTIRERIGETPDPALSHTLIKLGNQNRPGDVLSDPVYTPMIEYFSNKRATLYDFSNVDRALYSRNPGMVYPFLVQTDTSYILITEEMRDTRFTTSDQGILFLLQNSDHFVKIDENEGNEVWYFIKG